MGDEKKLLVSAISALILLCLVFALVVVITTKSRLQLGGGDPLLDGSGLPDEECGELMAVAAEAVGSGHLSEALSALSLIESLGCGQSFLARSAQLYRELGEPAETIRLLVGLLEKDPGSPRLLCEMAEALYAAGLPDSAKGYLRRAATLRGLSSESVRTLAWLALAQQESLLAETLFSRALSVEPEDPELWRALSQVRLGVDKAELAREAALRAIELDPERCGAYVALGWAHDRLGATSQAAGAFLDAVRLCPDDGRVIFEAGRFYYRRGDDDKALPLLRQSIGLQASPVEWFLLLALAEERAGDQSAARQTLKLACARYTQDFRPLVRLASLENRAGNTHKALSLAEEAHGLAPDNPDVKRLLSWLRG